ncbi:Amino acid ABC transporter, substrate binding protein [Desulfonema magnum]|uniref:Amino acid ABC transporter, substrate binding protein n=2 Tax=Desulfonema magnum TaxID=45655 RepID=A0A975BQQ0_9BACT|nr:Amino acid ABC transporter, substrate binding protein [Desulfonema magnum]
MKKILMLNVICLYLSLVAAGQVVASETVKIASVFAQTSVASVSNAPSIQGVRIAVSEINKQGGILGKKIELLEIDNRSTPEGSKAAAEKAAEQGVVAIIGANWNAHSMEVAKVAQDCHIPMISNASAHPDITRTGNYIFRVCFSDLFQGQVMARFARKDIRASKAVILKNINSEYSIGLAHEFRKYFEKLKGRVLLELTYTSEDQNFDKILEQSKAYSPDILFIPGEDESEVIAKQAQDKKISAIPLGGDKWGSTKLYRIGGESLKQGYFSTHWSKNTDRDITREYLRKYAGNPNSVFGDAALAYDATHLLADAIRRSGSFEREKIRCALAKTRNFKGVTGDITMDENGDAIKDVVIMQITNGEARYLKIFKP